MPIRAAAALFVLALAACPDGRAATGEESALKATEVEVCREIVQRQCQGLDRTFSADVESVAFMTRIEGATGDAFVTHVWYFEREEVRRVKLPVRGVSFRTWSTKTVKKLPGRWRVEVLDPVGRSLGAVAFVVEPPAEGR